ncbi:MAG: DNA adenine methylase, partial [Anaerolineales bacterium]
IMPYYSPLRYPGGKRRLANFIKLIYAGNGLSDGHYIELYAGGAAIALELLFDGFVSHAHINDLDRSIYAFWYSVLHETDRLCEQIRTTEVTIDEWYYQKEIQEQREAVSLFNLGFSTFFLNRTNRSGIIEGGVIGGKNQDGKYKIHARFNKTDLIHRIRHIGRYQNRISIYNEDAADFIVELLPRFPVETLVYLDPPYYDKGGELYKNSYEHKDHEKISQLISTVDHKWIISYDNTPEIRDIYAGRPFLVYDLHYSAADRYEGSEIIFFCDDRVIPDVDNPAKVDKDIAERSDQVAYTQPKFNVFDK